MNSNLTRVFKKTLFILSLRKATLMALVYMAISVILQLWGWFHPFISIPVTILIIASLIVYARKDKEYEQGWQVDLATLLQMCLLFAIVILMFYRTGIAGFYQPHSDYVIFRWTLYHNLIEAPWPVVLPDGREMSYYISGLLLPAVLSRFTDIAIVQHWILLIWSALPVFFILLLYFTSRKKISWLFFIFGLIIIANHAVLSIDGINILEKWFIEAVQLIFGDYNSSLLNGRWLPLCNNLPALSAITVPALCATLLILSPKKQLLFLVPLSMALLVFISPLGAIGLFPLACVCYFPYTRQFAHKLSSNILCHITTILLVISAAIYFVRADGNTFIGFTTQNWDISTFLIFYIPSMAVICILYAPVLWLNRHDTKIWVIFASVALCPFIFVGSLISDCHMGYNELWFKTQSTYLVLLGIYLVDTWQKLPTFMKYTWGYCGAVSVLLFIISFATPRLDDKDKELADKWNGHLYHPNEPFLFQSTPPCKAPIIPGAIMQKSGQSEHSFPGILLPDAPGCDYSRPAKRTNK